MPTYEYTCEKCGHSFDQCQSMSARLLSICPREVCPRQPWGKGKVKRAIGAGAGLIFKGSGFYITDHRSEKYREAAKKESAASATAGGAAKPGTDVSSKPKSDASPKPKADAKPPPAAKP